MDINGDVVIGGVSIIGSAGVAFGILKGKMSNYVSWPEHRDICHQKSDEQNTKLDKLLADMSEIKGYIKAKDGTGL